MKKIFVILMAIALAACTDPEGARKALEGAGYTDVKLAGYALAGCGRDDMYSTEFTARGVTGKSVSGVVCAGAFKGSTIRTY